MKAIFDLFKSEKKEKSSINLTTGFLKKTAKILVIDDHDVPLVSLLQNEGWSVGHWKDIQNLRDLEEGKYDLIFLDIGGIGLQFSPDEGLGVLKRLKTVNPSLLIVAYSGQSYDLSKAEFWQMADARLDKASGAIKAIEVLEMLMRKKWTPAEIEKDIQRLLEPAIANSDKLNKVMSTVRAGIGNSDANKAQRAIADLKLDTEVLSLVGKLVALAVEVMKT